MSDADLDDFLHDVVDGVDSELDVEPGEPDLAAVVARAHEIDPQRVPLGAVQEVSSWAPVVSLTRGRQRRETRDDDEMEAILHEVRAHVHQEVTEALHSPARAANSSAHAGRRWWVGALVAAAALLVIGIGSLSVRVLMQQVEPDPQEAVHAEGDDSGPQPLEAEVHRAPPTPTAQEVVPEEPEAPEVVPTGPKATAPKKQRKRRRDGSTKTDLDELIDQLEREAKVAWKARNVDLAEKKLRKITRIAKRRGAASRAYGDLFIIARDQNHPRMLKTYSREYLAKWPSGMHAATARGNLCQYSSGDQRLACWRTYVAKHPKGALISQANRELKKAGAQ